MSTARIPEPRQAATPPTTSSDPRRTFLQRAGARHTLLEAGELDDAPAIAELVEPFEELVGPLSCDCSKKIVERWDRDSPPIKNARPPKAHRTPESTIEAIMFCVRQRGTGALKEPTNVERLSRCDERARAEIDRRIAKMIKGASGERG